MVSKFKSVLQDYKLLLNNVPTMITLLFVCGTLAMNLAAAKVIFNFGIVAGTGGILLSFLPFLCMDTISKHMGARASIMLNILSSVFNIFVTVFLAIVAAIPTQDDYTAFNSVFGATWFIVVASNLAFITSGVVNSILNVTIGKLFGNKTSGIEFFTRSAVSTFVGQVVDNFLFMWLLYSIFGPMYWGLSPMPIITCLGTGILGGLLELACELIFTPLGYKIVKNWERNNIGHEYIEAHKDDRF